jgi:ligand-binding sensor domain-containing protein
MRWLTATFIFLVLGAEVFAQDIIARNITTDEGLPSSEVYCVIQDSAGFIWLGTDNGLARYDGKTFKVFSTKDGLPDNTVIRLNQDPDGKIWLTTLVRDIVYYQHGKFHPYDYQFIDSMYDLRYEVPVPLGVDSQGNMVMESLYHSLMAVERNGRFEAVTRRYDAVPAYETHSLMESVKLLTGQRVAHEKMALKEAPPGHFYTINKGDHYYIKGPFNQIHNSPSLYYHRRMNSGRVISLNGNGHYIISNPDTVYETGTVSARNVNHIYVQPNGSVWASTRGGVWRYDNEDFTTGKCYLKGQYNTGVLEDKEGNFWFTDHNKGLWVVNNINFKKLIVPKAGDQFRVAEIKHRNGKLWFSTIDGRLWNLDTNNRLEFIYEDQRRTYDVYPFEISKNGVMMLPNGLRLSPNRMTKFDYGFQGFERDKAIVRHGDAFLVATSIGVMGRHENGHWNYASHDIVNDSVRFDATVGRFSERCNALLVENDSIQWVGTLNGLYRKHGIRYSKIQRSDSLLSQRIMALAYADSAHIVIGTKGAGVLIYDKVTGEVVQIDETNGLTSDMVRSVYTKDNLIYAGTNRGLNVIYLNDAFEMQKIYRFDIYNGLESNEVNSIELFNDKLWLGTGKGVLYVDPDKLIPNTWAPPVFITGVQANDSNISFESGLLDLNVDQRYLTFNYNGVAYRAGNRIRYKYILSGFDPDTTFTTNSLARYTNVSPGTYTFMVWAQNEDGFWSETPATIRFTIPQKFTETWLYTATWLLLLIMFGSLIFYYFYRRKQDNLAIELQTSELKQQALAALMNPHFIYNSLSAIQHFINTDNGEKSNLYLSRFA